MVITSPRMSGFVMLADFPVDRASAGFASGAGCGGCRAKRPGIRWAEATATTARNWAAAIRTGGAGTIPGEGRWPKCALRRRKVTNRGTYDAGGALNPAQAGARGVKPRSYLHRLLPSGVVEDTSGIGSNGTCWVPGKHQPGPARPVRACYWRLLARSRARPRAFLKRGLGAGNGCMEGAGNAYHGRSREPAPA